MEKKREHCKITFLPKTDWIENANVKLHTIYGVYFKNLIPLISAWTVAK